MKSIITLLIVITCLSASAQSTSTDLKKVEILNSTSLALLDESAAIITSNPNVKEFNINTESLKSISFDGNLFTSNIKGLEYYGLGNTLEDFRAFTMQKINMPAVSGAYSNNDSISKVAIGIKINVFTLYNSTKAKMQEKYKVMVTEISDFDDMIESLIRKEKLTRGSDEYNKRYKEIGDELEKKEKEKKVEIQQEFADILKSPLLTLDIASAYSAIMPAKDFNKSQSGRFGAWSTLTFTLGKGDEHLKLYGFCRYIQDNTDYDSKSKKFTNQTNFFDVGSKAQFDWNKISVGYEYIKRNGDGKNYRSVGFVQYKVSDNLYVTGGFGKNFESALNDETVSLLGIRWGINAKDSRDWE